MRGHCDICKCACSRKLPCQQKDIPTKLHLEQCNYVTVLYHLVSDLSLKDRMETNLLDKVLTNLKPISVY